MYNWPVSADQASVKLAQLQKVVPWCDKGCLSVGFGGEGSWLTDVFFFSGN